MTVDEFNSQAEVILRHLGGSYSSPACEFAKGLMFRCSGITIYISNPALLTSGERKVVIEKLKEDYLNK